MVAPDHNKWLLILETLLCPSDFITWLARGEDPLSVSHGLL